MDDGLNDGVRSISEIYLSALQSMDGWVTVSEWAQKVGEKFPELLEKANKEASEHKNETTGLREIAARISSNISRGAYLSKIEINESERPRKVRALTDVESSDYEEKELEDDLAPIKRSQKIKSDFDKLTVKEQYRINEIETVTDLLRNFFNLDFEVDHANALLNTEKPGAHHPDNLQILLKSHNRMKSKNNWKRFTVEEQVKYIRSVLETQKMISKRMDIEIDDSVAENLVKRIEAVF